MAIITAAWAVMLDAALPVGARTLSALVSGHSYACLAFLAHDVAHGSVVRRRRLRFALEALLWAPLLVPPTLWRVLHNRTHHAHANTPRDCDRAYLPHDGDLGAKATYMRWFSPLRGSLGIANPLVLLHFTTYVVRNLLALGPGLHTPVLAAMPSASRRERWAIMLEFGTVLVVHVAVVATCWTGLETLLLLELAPITMASATLMLFIFTNHLSRPIMTSPETLSTTVSIELPSIAGKVYSHFNLHIEHHLFPSAPSGSYPEISRHVRMHAAGAYCSRRLVDAWRDVLDSPFIRPAGEPLDTRGPRDAHARH